MPLRPMPADDDVFRYDLDAIQYGGTGLGGPTLREIMHTACTIGDDEGIHDDVEHANEYAGICELFRPVLERNTTLTITVKDARRLHAALMSAWSYADQNNYGADDEPDDNARNFGRHGEFMIGHLTFPWGALVLPADGNHGFTLVQETS